MSKITYIMPWAISDTSSVFTKTIEQEPLGEDLSGTIYDNWTINKIIRHPDGRKKIQYVILDPYCGNLDNTKYKINKVIELTNSRKNLKSLGYTKVTGNDKDFIRNSILLAAK